MPLNCKYRQHAVHDAICIPINCCPVIATINLGRVLHEMVGSNNSVGNPSLRCQCNTPDRFQVESRTVSNSPYSQHEWRCILMCNPTDVRLIPSHVVYRTRSRYRLLMSKNVNEPGSVLRCSLVGRGDGVSLRLDRPVSHGSTREEWT
jgi:hypothetical protein